MTSPVPPIHHRHPHPDVTGGWLRPAVFGAMDGLVSNFALIMGFAGGGAASGTVVLAGLAGLAAGACSMAAGEYISVTSQAEAALHEVEIERREIRTNPRAEIAELAERFISQGVEPEAARVVAEQLHRDPEVALRVHTLDEMHVDPDDLASPWLAAGSSLLAFTVGAFIPLLPFLLGVTSVVPSSIAAAVALFTGGAVVTRVTTTRWWAGGLRQLMFGAGAAALTYLLGRIVGT